MSGSHTGQPPQRDGRYTLEDTLYELSAVTPHPAWQRGDGHVLSAANLEAAGCRVQRAAPAGEPNCTVWTDKVDGRLAALEAQVTELRRLLARLEDGK